MVVAEAVHKEECKSGCSNLRGLLLNRFQTDGTLASRWMDDVVAKFGRGGKVLLRCCPGGAQAMIGEGAGSLCSPLGA